MKDSTKRMYAMANKYSKEANRYTNKALLFYLASGCVSVFLSACAVVFARKAGVYTAMAATSKEIGHTWEKEDELVK